MKHTYRYDLTSKSNLVLLTIYLFISCNNPIENDKELISKADAGDDQITYVGSYAVLDISQSVIKEPIKIIDWIQNASNPEEVFLFSQSSLIDAWRVGFEKEGVYKFTLKINCNSGNVYSDSILVTVKPRQISLIEDVNLEVRIRQILKYKEGDLNADKLKLLDSLSNYNFPLKTKVTSIKGLENCINLKYLALGLERITDLTPLSGLLKLEYLDLNQNYTIEDISSIHNLINLKTLILYSNPIKDISGLGKLIKLTELDLNYTPISDISSLNNLLNLELLTLGGVGTGIVINNIEPLKNLIKLRQLDIAGRGIIDIQPLENLVELELLYLSFNNLSRISPISKLKKVIRLYIRLNKVEDLNGMMNLENLDYLDAADNKIKDLSEFQYLKNIHLIGLSGNKIEDIAPLANNPNLGVGVYLYLGGNPLNEKSLNEYIPALIARGVKVFMI